MWVGLAEAAKILGVHPATVRTWADRGHLPSQRTPGGHRRFRVADLTQMLAAQKSGTAAEAQLLVQSAMGRARVEIGEGHMAGADWYRRLDEKARDELALYGRRLMDVLKRHLTAPSAGALSDARELGLKYGEALHTQNLNLRQAVDGFFTFHDVIVDSLISVIEMTRSTGDWGDAMRNVNAFTREVMLALVETYEEPQDATV
jgi:excisionase family DNA binding protein